MKRIIAPLLVLLLALYGCQTKPEPIAELPDPTVPETAAPTEQAGILNAGSAAEIATNGAIRTYIPEQSDTTGVLQMGADLLLFSGAGNTTLTKYSGQQLCLTAQVHLDCRITVTDPAVQVCENGIVYYDGPQNDLVYLDADLREVKRTPLPEHCGSPALSEDRQTLYYCIAGSVRCMDLESGLDRLLKEMNFQSLTCAALLCGDTVLQCDAADDDGNPCRLYISAENGQLLAQTTDATAVFSHNDLYFATHQDGVYLELLTGDAEQGPTLLAINTEITAIFPVLKAGGIILLSQDPDADTSRLDHYDLRTGKCTATLTLHGREPVLQVCAADNGSIWYLRHDPERSKNALFQWDLSATPPQTPDARLSARFTADNPNKSGLAACRGVADSLSAKYGVQILLWTDATHFQPQDYTLVPEHQVPVIEKQLQKLDEVLSLYPEGFLQKAAETSACGRIQICLVRSIESDAPTGDTMQNSACLQYWDDIGNAFLCISAQKDSITQDVCHGLFHIIDSRVMTVCKAYDEWNKLNPKGFAYDYDYTANLSRQDSQWIEGKTRAFINTYAMSYPMEDRAQIMVYAMLPGNGTCFQSETMQKKLQQLCNGIREAFDLKKSTEILPWEQYLINAE